jgi:hypothetical protein
MGIIKTILLASTEIQGFKDGVNGRYVSFEYTSPFPQDSEPAVAYLKGYKAGQETAKVQTTVGINKVLNKLTGED